MRDTRVGAAHASMQRRDRAEYRRRIERVARGTFLKLVRQHVQQDFRIRIGVDVAAIDAEHLTLQLFRVGQIAVVPERDAEGRIDVKRLRFFNAER